MPIDSRALATLTIANAQTTSDTLDIVRGHSYSFRMPTAWTAATLGIQVQCQGDATNWFDVCNEDGPLVLPAAASRLICLSASLLLPNSANKLRLVSSVAQGASRAIIVECREFS